jgi:hypothetical protein
MESHQVQAGCGSARLDYFLKVGKLTLGAALSDHDFMEDDREDQLQRLLCERYVLRSVSATRTTTVVELGGESVPCLSGRNEPEVSMTTEVLDLMDYEFPIPTIETTLRLQRITERPRNDCCSSL